MSSNLTSLPTIYIKIPIDDTSDTNTSLTLDHLYIFCYLLLMLLRITMTTKDNANVTTKETFTTSIKTVTMARRLP